MVSAFHELERFAGTLVARGVLLVLLGAVALVRPDDLFVDAMLASAFVLATTGIYAMALAMMSRQAAREWPIALADGAAAVGLALLTATTTLIPFRQTMIMIAIWLAIYAVFTGAMALALWPMHRTRDTLLAWSALDLVLAGVATSSHATIFVVFIAGASYVMVLGAFEIAAGVWIRRIAMPQYGPTIQSQWHGVAAAALHGAGRAHGMKRSR